VRTSVEGSCVRIQLSNEFGTEPLRIEDAHIAERSSGSSIVPATDRQFRFGGKLFAIVPTGAVITSDAIVYDVPSLTDLVISFYLPSMNGAATFHPSAHQTNYIAPGEVSGKETLPEAIKVASYYFRLCTTICKNVRSARVSGNAHFGLVQPPKTTFAPKWAEFRVRRGNDARWDL
jgi:hypothetical protein